MDSLPSLPDPEEYARELHIVPLQEVCMRYGLAEDNPMAVILYMDINKQYLLESENARLCEYLHQLKKLSLIKTRELLAAFA